MVKSYEMEGSKGHTEQADDYSEAHVAVLKISARPVRRHARPAKLLNQDSATQALKARGNPGVAKASACEISKSLRFEAPAVFGKAQASHRSAAIHAGSEELTHRLRYGRVAPRFRAEIATSKSGLKEFTNRDSMLLVARRLPEK
jgi:hypothetical protein